MQASSGHSANPKSSARNHEVPLQLCRRLRALTPVAEFWNPTGCPGLVQKAIKLAELLTVGLVSKMLPAGSWDLARAHARADGLCDPGCDVVAEELGRQELVRTGTSTDLPQPQGAPVPGAPARRLEQPGSRLRAGADHAGEPIPSPGQAPLPMARQPICSGTPSFGCRRAGHGIRGWRGHGQSRSSSADPEQFPQIQNRTAEHDR